MVEHWANKSQASRRKAQCQIFVDGEDVTARVDPHLLSVVVIDKIGGIDTCNLELDDRDGRLHIPGAGSRLQVLLGWHSESFYLVFAGMIDSCESGFGRKHGGRRLWIDATGTSQSGNGKTPQQMSWGEGVRPGETKGTPIKLSTVLQEAAGRAGYSMQIAGKLGAIERDFWSMNTESFHHFGNRLAHELGGAFKISGGVASFVDRLSFTDGAGAALGTINAIWSENLIEWRIKPFASRPSWAGAAAQYFDIQKSQWLSVNKSLGGGSGFLGGVKAITQLPAPAPNAQVGGQQNDGAAAASLVQAGTGWCRINGEPQARAMCKLTISGARDGVDGTYSIDEAQHHYLRGGGYTTLCKVWQVP